MTQMKFVLSREEVFWNLIGTANSRAAEVNSLNLDKSPGHFFKINERPGYEATITTDAKRWQHCWLYSRPACVYFGSLLDSSEIVHEWNY